MNVQEWSLIAFTILSQMTVGSFVVLGVVHFFARRKAGEQASDQLSDRALLAIGPVMILALIASLFHLGSPLNAFRAVANLDTSWLSREILFGVLFTVVGGLFAIMQWRKIGSVTLRTVIAWIATIVGLVFVYSMSRVYMLSTVPTWNTWFTPISFFTTTFLLGALAIGAAYVAAYAYLQRKEPEDIEVQSGLLRNALQWIAVASVVLLGVEFVIIPLNLANQYTGTLDAVISVREVAEQYMGIFALRLILVFLGAGVFSLILYRNVLRPGRETTVANLVYVAFALVLVSEVLGRFLFYSSYVSVGI